MMIAIVMFSPVPTAVFMLSVSVTDQPELFVEFTALLLVPAVEVPEAIESVNDPPKFSLVPEVAKENTP